MDQKRLHCRSNKPIQLDKELVCLDKGGEQSHHRIPSWRLSISYLSLIALRTWRFTVTVGTPYVLSFMLIYFKFWDSTGARFTE